MKLTMITITMLVLSASSNAHYGNSCFKSIECIERISPCHVVKDRVHSLFYLVRKSMKCNSHHHESEQAFIEKEEFETTLGYSKCSGFRQVLKETYPACE